MANPIFNPNAPKSEGKPMNAEEYRAAIHRITEDVKNVFPVRKKVKFRSRKQQQKLHHSR